MQNSGQWKRNKDRRMNLEEEFSTEAELSSPKRVWPQRNRHQLLAKKLDQGLGHHLQAIMSHWAIKKHTGGCKQTDPLVAVPKKLKHNTCWIRTWGSFLLVWPYSVPLSPSMTKPNINQPTEEKCKYILNINTNKS